MAYYINTQPSTDKYDGAGAIVLGPFLDADTVTVLVSGNPAAMQFFVGDESHGRWTDEREYVAPAGNGTTNSFKVGNVHGIRVRSANAGASAVVSVTLFRTGAVYDSHDPIFEAGSLSPGTVTSSGGVNPGQASVEVDHNGAKIAAEPIFDLEDAGANAWTVVDDLANTRVKVTPPKVITARVNADGTVAGGAGFTVNKTGTGTYLVTWTAAFPGTPTCIATSVSPGLNAYTQGAGAANVTITTINGISGALQDCAFNLLAFLTG